MTGPCARSKHRGFTLIEVLVALAIVAIGMAAVLEALSSSANTVSFLRDKTFAQWVALNQIATTRLTAEQQGQAPQAGNTDGDVDFAGRKWHYRQEVTTTELPSLVRIDVKVRPTDVKAEDDKGWYTTVSGLYGDALAPARGDLPVWGSATQQPAGQGAVSQQGGGFVTTGTGTDSSFFSPNGSSSGSISSSSSSSSASSDGSGFSSGSSSSSSSSSDLR
jgi:general secretion pathway protein I